MFQQVKSQIKKPADYWESQSKTPFQNKQLFSQQCMKVYCRIKPLIQTQQQNGMMIDQGQNSLTLSNQQVNRSVSKKFTFTQIFKDQSQRQIIQKVCDPIIQSLTKQQKGALIFAYGVTNSGKTYTILGTKQQPGILNYLLQKLPNNIKLTPIEIYNEQYFPLTMPRFKLHPKQATGFFQFKDYDPILITQQNKNTVLHQCYQNRLQTDTQFNQKSSRSHAIFKIQVQNKIIGVVDLAGSERSRQGCNLTQTASINKSLLCLGRCIQALKQQKSNPQIQIPYRQSKLTKALMQYFNPDYNLVMIVNINPVKLLINQTLKVLQYAALARDIKQNTPVISRYKNTTNSKAKIFVTLQETKSQVDYISNKSKIKSKKCNSVYQYDFNEEKIQDQRKYRELTDYVAQLKKQSYINEHYCKLKANHEIFNFYYEQNFRKQQRETDQELRRLQSYKKSIKQILKPTNINMSKIDTCINTSPIRKSDIESEIKKKIELNLTAMYQFKYRLQQQQLNQRLKQAQQCQNNFRQMIQNMKKDKENYLKLQIQKQQQYNKRIQQLQLKLKDKISSVQIIKQTIQNHSNRKPNKFHQVMTSPFKFLSNSSSKIKNAFIDGIYNMISPTKKMLQQKQQNKQIIIDHKISFGQNKIDKKMIAQQIQDVHKSNQNNEIKVKQQQLIIQNEIKDGDIKQRIIIEEQKNNLGNVEYLDEQIQTNFTPIKQNVNPNSIKSKYSFFNFNIYESKQNINIKYNNQDNYEKPNIVELIADQNKEESKIQQNDQEDKKEKQKKKIKKRIQSKDNTQGKNNFKAKQQILRQDKKQIKQQYQQGIKRNISPIARRLRVKTKK